MPTKEEIHNHSRANEYLELNKISGDYFEKGKEKPTPPEGWNIVDKQKDRSNFKGVLYQNGDEYAIVFCGTDVKSPKDWATNAEMVTKGETKQCKDAVKFYDKMAKDNKIDPEKLVIIGNSEGARETVKVIADTDAEYGVTFNGYTKTKNNEYPADEFTNLVNYRTEKDVVSKCGKTIGTDYIVPLNKEIEKNLKPVYSAIQSHRIQNIGTIDSTTVIPAKDYDKITGKKFKNKYGEGILKSDEIGEIPPQIYPIVDDDVNERLSKGQVINAIDEEVNNIPETNNEPLTIDNFNLEEFQEMQDKLMEQLESEILEVISENSENLDISLENTEETETPTEDENIDEEDLPEEEETETEAETSPAQSFVNSSKKKKKKDDDNIRIFYKWISEDGACEACSSKDGETSDEGYTKPVHPNCRCYKVKEVEDYSEPNPEKNKIIDPILRNIIKERTSTLSENEDTFGGKYNTPTYIPERNNETNPLLRKRMNKRTSTLSENNYGFHPVYRQNLNQIISSYYKTPNFRAEQNPQKVLQTAVHQFIRENNLSDKQISILNEIVSTQNKYFENFITSLI